MAFPKLEKLWSWQVIVQVVFLVAIVTIGAIAGHNLTRNLDQLGLTFGFNFLNSQASFPIREAAIPYQPSDSYSRALLVGLLNTFKVMVVATILATICGVTAGIARLSPNWLLRQIALVYVELLRNIPLLLQLFFYYSAVFLNLPAPPNKVDIGGWLYLSNNGITLPSIQFGLSAEFCSLVLGLSLYTGTFIAEIVRGAISSINKGQWEASRALGLSSSLTMRLVILPQALRIIIPPLTSQYLNIAKNSSLAIAIAYEDVYALSSTTFNQTGRSVETVLLLMVTYLSISLAISLVMNLLNRKVQIPDGKTSQNLRSI